MSTKFFHNIYNKIVFRGLKHKNFSLISRDCLGGFLYSDMNKRFLSPTINLSMTEDDFIQFVFDLKYYLNAEIKEVNTKKSYPVGKISKQNCKDIYIHFMHYDNFKQAKSKWVERSKRVDWNNIVILFHSFDFAASNKHHEHKHYDAFKTFPYQNKLYVSGQNTPDEENCAKLPALDNPAKPSILETKPGRLNFLFNKQYYNDYNFGKYFRKISKNKNSTISY